MDRPRKRFKTDADHTRLSAEITFSNATDQKTENNRYQGNELCKKGS